MKEDLILIEPNKELKTFTVVSKRTDELTAEDFDNVIKQLEGSIKQIDNQLENLEKQVEVQKKEALQNKDLFQKRLASFKDYQNQANLWKTIEQKEEERKPLDSIPSPQEVMNSVPESKELPQ